MKTRDRVVTYLKKFPNARTVDIATKLGVNPSHVSTIRNQSASLKPTVPESKLSPIQLAVDIGNQPVTIKLTNKGTVIGTLTASRDGLRYRKANAKKDNGRLLRWEIVQQLQVFGVVTS